MSQKILNGYPLDKYPVTEIKPDIKYKKILARYPAFGKNIGKISGRKNSEFIFVGQICSILNKFAGYLVSIRIIGGYHIKKKIFAGYPVSRKIIG